MKQLLAILYVFMLLSCGGGGFKNGSVVEVSKRCICAYSETSYSEMSKLCNRKDEAGLERMDARGQIDILSYGTLGTVVQNGFTKTQIRLADGSEVWVANEFLRNYTGEIDESEVCTLSDEELEEIEKSSKQE